MAANVRGAVDQTAVRVDNARKVRVAGVRGDQPPPVVKLSLIHISRKTVTTMKKTTFKQCAAGDVFEHQGQAPVSYTHLDVYKRQTTK